MSNQRAALRYSKATLAYASEMKAADKVERDMRQIKDTLEDSNELREFLIDPTLKMGLKKDTLLKVFSNSQEITKGLIDTLAANKRLDLLPEVAFKFIALYEQMKGEEIALVTTAVALDDVLEKKILTKVKQLTGKEVILESKIDASILGGFILRVGDLRYDASVASKLENLKREFTNNI